MKKMRVIAGFKTCISVISILLLLPTTPVESFQAVGFGVPVSTFENRAWKRRASLCMVPIDLVDKTTNIEVVDDTRYDAGMKIVGNEMEYTANDNYNNNSEEKETVEDNTTNEEREEYTKCCDNEASSTEDQRLATKVAVAKKLMGVKKGQQIYVGSRSQKQRTHSSVGPLEGKGASRRTGTGAVGKVLSVVTKTAAAAAAAASTTGQDDSTTNYTQPSQPTTNSGDNDDSNDVSVTAKASKSSKTKERLSDSLVKSTIQKMLQQQEDTRSRSLSIFEDTDNAPSSAKKLTSAGQRPEPPTMGLFGERIPAATATTITTDHLPSKPYPGTVLHPPTVSFLSPQNPVLPAAKTAVTHKNTLPLSHITDAVTIRIASKFDDCDIANLRLSVFSDYTSSNQRRNNGGNDNKENSNHNNIQHRFRIRSRQLLESRRTRGAICLVASLPKVFRGDFVAHCRNKSRGLINSVAPNYYDWKKHAEWWPTLEDHEKEDGWTMGSVECSVHEFYGTTLGKRRTVGSILYVTEVAVNPDARLVGIGKKLLEGVDELARVRNVESLYLHVDVTNTAAIRLYTNTGYTIVEPNLMHREFTQSLNLHDGAGNGRSHFLLVKHLKEPHFLDLDTSMDDADKVKQTKKIDDEIKMIGFG